MIINSRVRNKCYTRRLVIALIEKLKKRKRGPRARAAAAELWRGELVVSFCQMEGIVKGGINGVQFQILSVIGLMVID